LAGGIDVLYSVEGLLYSKSARVERKIVSGLMTKKVIVDQLVRDICLSVALGVGKWEYWKAGNFQRHKTDQKENFLILIHSDFSDSAESTGTQGQAESELALDKSAEVESLLPFRMEGILQLPYASLLWPLVPKFLAALVFRCLSMKVAPFHLIQKP
jgi:hypothetical protein